MRPRFARAPTPKSASLASSRLPMVAESPQVRAAGARVRRRASASSICTPRLEPISSCHSSTTTVRRSAKRSLTSARVSNRVRLSGVVTNAVGRRLLCRARMPAPVSPVRDSSVHGIPRSLSGAARDASVSAARARSGVIHSTRNGGAVARRRRGRSRGSGRELSSANHSRSGPHQAASVFPVPVAA